MRTLIHLLKHAIVQVTARPVLDLHNDQRGNVTFMMLALVMLFGGMVSSLVNTATVVDEKMQLQTAADTAAYASAVHLSREINMVTSANISIALLKSAQAVTMANNLAFIQAVVNYGSHAKAIADIFKAAKAAFASVFGIPLGVALTAQGIAYTIQLVIEVVAVTVWYFATLKGIQGILETIGIFAGNGDLGGRITELYEYQQEVIEETPRLIEEQRGYLSEYYRCEIRITQPGQDNIATTMNSPLERGNGIDFAIPLSLAYYGSPIPMVLTGSIKDEDYGTMQEQWHGSGSGVSHFLTNRKGAMSYPALSKREVYTDTKTVLPSYAAAAAGMLIRREYHSLKSNNPTESERDRERTLIATAHRDNGSSSAFYMGGPLRDEPAFGTGVFNDGVNPGDRMMAVAEAETYNPVAESIASLGIGVINHIPWQVHSTMGMNWQARLAETTALKRAIDGDNTLQNIMNAAGIEASDAQRLQDIIQH